MYVIYIGSDKIRIVEANASLRKIKINSLYSALTPNDYLDNPNEKTFAELSNVIAQGLVEMGGKGKKVKIVLENGTIPFTQKELKTMPTLKVINLIRNEIFSDEKLASSNVLDYVEIQRYYKHEELTEKEQNEKWATFLGTNKKPVKKEQDEIQDESQENKKKKEVKKTRKVLTSKVFFTYISRSTIKHLEKFFKDLGYKLVSIDIYQNAIRKLVNSFYLPENKKAKDNMILFEYKEDAITVFLFKENKLEYTFRKNLALSLSEQFGTNSSKSENSFITELSDAIKESLQFFRSKYKELEYNKIYLTGLVENFENWKEILISKIAYDVEILKTPSDIQNVDDFEFNEFSGAIAGFLSNGGQ